MTDSAPSSINPRTYCNRCDADYVPGDLVVGPYPLGDYRHATCPDDGNACTNDRLPRFTYSVSDLDAYNEAGEPLPLPGECAFCGDPMGTHPDHCPAHSDEVCVEVGAPAAWIRPL
jgi:hypothetical protein